MAVTTRGMDQAEIARCVEVNGRFVRPLNWVFVKFDDATEVDRYVMPATCGVHLWDAKPYRETLEVMADRAFPHETDFGPRPTDGDLSKPGPRAIHYFGGV